MTVYTGTPSTLVAGDTSALVTKFNDHRDALKAVSEAWTSYGSASSFTASTSNPTLNSGTWAAKYRQVGKAVDFYVKVTFAADSTVGSGNYRVALPVAPATTDPGFWTVVVADTSTGAYYTGTVYTWTGTTASLAVINPAGGIQQVTPTVPMTFFAGDWIVVRGSYEAA